jgi:VanZ family protein
MTTDGRQGRQGLRLTLWWLCVAVWTAALLTPQPVRAGQEVLPPESIYSTSKTLHVVAYGLLAGSLPWLGPRGGRRWWLVAFLSLHAGATEFLQQWVPSRNASLTDVGFDLAGIALGLACTWRAWRAPR